MCKTRAVIEMVEWWGRCLCDGDGGSHHGVGGVVASLRHHHHRAGANDDMQ